jgi:hypothetical protein
LIEVLTSPSIWYGEVDFIIRNQVNNIALIRGTCHVSKGEKYGDFNTMITPMNEASVKVKISLSSFESIECCLVYELVNQRNESNPIMEDHQVFIAVRVSAKSLISKYKASAVMFMTRMGQFAGSEGDIRRLREGILQEHLVNETYSFRYAVNGRVLRLDAVFHPGRKSILEVTLDETIGHIYDNPVLFE